MAITSSSFNSPGTPDKHVVPGRAQGPSVTGDYSNSTTVSAPSSDTDNDAMDIYGPTGDATRMSRRAGLVEEALEATPNGIEGATNTGPAFIDGSTFSGASKTDGVKDAGSVSFPETQGNSISAPKAVTAKSNASNNPAVKGSPGFPGLP